MGKLPSTNLSSQFTGTLPQQRFMDSQKIKAIPVTKGQYTVPEHVTDYGATTKGSTYQTTTATQHQRLLGCGAEEDSDSEDGAYPFGKRLPDGDGRDDDHEGSKCWCTLL